MTHTYSLTSDAAAGGALPFLTLAHSGLADDAPVVLVLHGLGRGKEHMLPSLYAFAREGFRAVALDARLHGERPDAPGREQRLQDEHIPTLYEMIAGTASDVTLLLDHLGVARAAVHGVSLGGYITFAALLAEPRLTVATVAMGSPDWLGGLRGLGFGPGHAAYDAVARLNPLDLAAQSYPPRPLLMLHGADDDVVSVEGVVALFDRLRPLYRDTPERLKLVVTPALGHRYTDEMASESVAWTKRFL